MPTEEEVTFKTGDIVVLKSGGPLMTVASVTKDQVGTIYWSKEVYAESSFNPDVLKKQ